jgi:hypothetical protein
MSNGLNVLRLDGCFYTCSCRGLLPIRLTRQSWTKSFCELSVSLPNRQEEIPVHGRLAAARPKAQTVLRYMLSRIPVESAPSR